MAPAPVLDAEPASPVRGFDIADVGDARIGLLALQCKDGRGHPPPGHGQLAPVGLIADHWRQVVGKDSGQGRHVARSVAHGARQLPDRLLALRLRVAQGPALSVRA